MKFDRDQRYSKKIQNGELKKVDEDVPDVRLKWNAMLNLIKSS